MYIGVDLHKLSAVVTALDESGQEVLTTKFRNTREGWEEFHTTFSQGGRVVLESTVNHLSVVELLESWGYQVSVAHSLGVRAIATSKAKTDKIDSRILAKLLHADFLPTCYVPAQKVREMRELLRHRIKLGRDAAQVKNRIHALLTKHWVTHEFSDLFGRGGRRFLADLELPTLTRYILDSLLRELDLLQSEIAKTQGIQAELALEDEQIQRLMQIRGIDFYSAQIIVNEIGDIHRFPSHRQLASYAGLVPIVRNSADKVRHGHITKQGNRNLRWILVEAVTKAKDTDPNLKQKYQRLCKRRGKMIARVALARHLLRVIYYMLRDKTDYRYTSESLYQRKKEHLKYLALLSKHRNKQARKRLEEATPSTTPTRPPQNLNRGTTIMEARPCFS